MTRAILALSFFLAAHVGAPDPRPHRPAPDAPPPQLMINIMALLNAAREFHTDPSFAFSVTWEESRMKERAIGRHRNDDGTWGPILARGLMQISVQYQDELVRKYLPGMSPRAFDPWNPKHSARLGCAMLADFVPKYGRWGALACYNAGEGRYRELMHGRALPAETVEYQRRVLG